MAKNPIYGYTNRIMAEISAYLLQDKNFCNFLYYTDKKYEYTDLTELEIPPTNEIYDKLFFVFKRIPEVVHEAKAFVYLDVYRDIPIKLGSPIRTITFTATILVHRDCVRCLHGHRGICIKDSLEIALAELSGKNTIGNIELSRVSPVLGLVEEYMGYTLQLKVDNFSPRFNNKYGE